MISKHPWIISVVVVLALTAWIASGSVGNGDEKPKAEKESATATEKTKTAVRVRVRQVEAQSITESLMIYGRTAPSRSVTLKAETQGKVAEILVQRGAAVTKGQDLVRLEMNDRTQQLEAAKAQLAERQLQWQGAQSLNTKGFQGKTDLAGAEADLKETQALIARLQTEIEHTMIKAPFDGVLQERLVEVGDYASIGDPIAMVADLNPIIVKGDLSQIDVTKVKAGDTAEIKLSDGTQIPGKVRYLASVADDATNTFRIEVEADNSKLSVVAGLTAEIQIPLIAVEAIKVSPSQLSLNEAGEIGIKWVKDGVVQFTPIQLAQSNSDGTWITGIGANASIITVGQAFVREGDKVEAVSEGD